MWKEIMIFFGLSIDSFVLMMNKGAQLRNMNMKKISAYALEFALVAMGMFMLGFLFSKPIVISIEKAKVEIVIACLIILIVGTMISTKAVLNKEFEEKLDDSFDSKVLLKQALITSIDVFFVGAAYGFLAVHALNALIISFVITFLTVLTALLIGYNCGAKYQRIIRLIGGILMVFFGIYLITTYIVMR